MIAREGALTAPIVALDKRLRDGRRLVLTLVRRNRQEGPWSYWMQAEIGGEIVAAQFTARVQRNSSPVDGLPHTISVPIAHQFRPVGLTDAEADRIDAATREWRQRRIRLAREAAPGARTWKVQDLPSAPPTGGIMDRRDGSGPVMVLRRAFREIEDDGLSFGLDDESGQLVTVTVRALTDDEQREWRELQDRQAQVDAAYLALFAPPGTGGLFGWAKYGQPIPSDADICTRTDVPVGGDAQTLYIMGSPWVVTLAGDALYCQANTGRAEVDAIRHPATAERLAVFTTLYEETDGTGFLHELIR
uniref:hypothetical protein n=1 Tax=Nonomuraea sp. CA-251285 TaxID=3240002 RepID=UPI003F49132C